MATQPPRRVLEPLAAPQHQVPPSARELRAQAVQRLQAGLFGIAAVVLVVGLANIINDRARQSDAAAKPAASAAPRPSVSDSSDPLADVGVVPSNVPEAAASLGPAAPTAQN
ncbi:MAG: hypothetical protein K2W91_01140 [Novosphingobium sp.]|nr:hypothetical protein [Novosphingobium sp.]